MLLIKSLDANDAKCYAQSQRPPFVKVTSRKRVICHVAMVERRRGGVKGLGKGARASRIFGNGPPHWLTGCLIHFCR